MAQINKNSNNQIHQQHHNPMNMSGISITKLPKNHVASNLNNTQNIVKKPNIEHAVIKKPGQVEHHSQQSQQTKTKNQLVLQQIQKSKSQYQQGHNTKGAKSTMPPVHNRNHQTQQSQSVTKVQPKFTSHHHIPLPPLKHQNEKPKIQYPNFPVQKRQKGDYYDSSVLFALSTRQHHFQELLPTTGQQPSNKKLTFVDYKSQEEFKNDFELKEDQNILSHVRAKKDGGICVLKGVSEGYVLENIEGIKIQTVSSSTTNNIMSTNVEELLDSITHFPVLLGFISPLAEAPNLSDRQCGSKLGIGYVKEKILKIATEEIEKVMLQTMSNNNSQSLTYPKFRQVMRSSGILWLKERELRILFKSMDTDASGDVDMDEWKFALSDKFMYDDTFSHLHKRITRFHIKNVSQYMEQLLRHKQTNFLTLPELASCFFRGGITWLTRQQLAWLFQHLDDNNNGIITFSEWTSRFQYDVVESAHEISRHLKYMFRELGIQGVPKGCGVNDD